jgi:hypothetical protein
MDYHGSKLPHRKLRSSGTGTSELRPGENDPHGYAACLPATEKRIDGQAGQEDAPQENEAFRLIKKH